MNEIIMPLTNLNYRLKLQKFVTTRAAQGGERHIQRNELDVLANYLARCAGYLTNIIIND